MMTGMLLPMCASPLRWKVAADAWVLRAYPVAVDVRSARLSLFLLTREDAIDDRYSRSPQN